jgi:hypothetical protein
MSLEVVGIDGEGHEAFFTEFRDQGRHPIRDVLHEGTVIADERDQDRGGLTGIGKPMHLTRGIWQVEIGAGSTELDHGGGDTGHSRSLEMRGTNRNVQDGFYADECHRPLAGISAIRCR